MISLFEWRLIISTGNSRLTLLACPARPRSSTTYCRAAGGPRDRAAPRSVRAGHRRRNRPGLPDAAAAHDPGPGRRGGRGRESEQLTCAGFLAELLLAECDDRDRRRSARRLKAAGFPREKWLTDFDYTANPNIAPAVIANLATCAWIAKGEPLCLIGDSGTGKSHLLIALGARTPPNKGHRVKYVLAAKLANELVEAADDRLLSKTIARYRRVDLLCLDELGYMELDRRGPSCCSRC